MIDDFPCFLNVVKALRVAGLPAAVRSPPLYLAKNVSIINPRLVFVQLGSSA